MKRGSRQTNANVTCQAISEKGERCSLSATSNGYCARWHAALGAHTPREESTPPHSQANAAAEAIFAPTAVATRAHGPPQQRNGAHPPQGESVPPLARKGQRSAVFPPLVATAHGAPPQEGSAQPQANAAAQARSAVQAHSDDFPQHLGAQGAVHADFKRYEAAFLPPF
jgi:hypothetical protein